MRNTWASLVALIGLFASFEADAEKCPNMLVLLDRSSSMEEGSKWGEALAAIETFTPTRQAVMRFGLQVFPAPGDRCGGGATLVQPNFYAATEISASLLTLEPGGATPTADALEAAADSDAMRDLSRRRFVILITDGDPTCPFESRVDDNHAQSLDAVRTLLAAGVKTFVIGFGTDATPARLNELASAGGTSRAGASCRDPNTGGALPCGYYEAEDRESLAEAFDQIAQVASGELQGRTCDDSCYGVGGCAVGERCVAQLQSFNGGEFTLNTGKCVPDPCAGVTCGADQFCRDGQCIDACLSYCPAPKICGDGQCIDDPCTANPESCLCAQICPRFLACIDGQCADDPCRSISCPLSAPYCNLGNCYAAPPPPKEADAGFVGDSGTIEEPPRGEELAGAGCTCSASSPARPGGLMFPAALLLALCAARLAQRRSAMPLRRSARPDRARRSGFA